MDRLVSVLLLVLIAAVVGLGVVIWRADHHAREDAQRLACLERAHATAAISMMAPEGQIDEEGRLEAMRVLGERLDSC